MFLSSFSLLSLVILGHASSQSVLGSKHPANIYAQSPYAAPYDDGLFTPVEDLSALSTDSFTTLGHPFFPNYSVRIKKTVFDCDTKSTSVHLSRVIFQAQCRLLVLTQVTSTIKRDTSSSTSLRAATILLRTMSSSG